MCVFRCAFFFRFLKTVLKLTGVCCGTKFEQETQRSVVVVACTFCFLLSHSPRVLENKRILSPSLCFSFLEERGVVKKTRVGVREFGWMEEEKRRTLLFRVFFSLAKKKSGFSRDLCHKKKSEHKEEREKKTHAAHTQTHASCSSSSFEERWFCLWRSSGRGVDVFFISFLSSFSIDEYEHEKHVQVNILVVIVIENIIVKSRALSRCCCCCFCWWWWWCFVVHLFVGVRRRRFERGFF
jgi:hypothetical protein